MRKEWVIQRSVYVSSWIVVALLIFAAGTMLYVGATPGGPVGRLIGLESATFFYVILYTVEATLLTVAKFLRHNKMIKWVLFVIYLTSFFISALTLALAGYNFRVLDNMLMGLLAGYSWLVRTMREDWIYLDDLPKN